MMMPTPVEHVLSMSERLLICLEGSDEGIVWVDFSLVIVMIVRQMLFMFTLNSLFLEWKDLMGK